MDKKVVLKQLGKMCIAGIFALLFLCLFSVFYYLPVTRVTQPNGATEYTRESNRFHTHFREGHGIGVTDENGYTNVKKQRIKAVPDILLMGSSHMEAENVLESESTIYRLNEIFRESNTDLFAYNIGMAAQYFCVCAKNLNDALEVFHPTRYVVIETNTVIFNQEDIIKVLENRMELSREIHDTGILYWLQKIPYLKLIYQQWKNVHIQTDKTETVSDTKIQPTDIYAESLNHLIQVMEDTAQVYGVKLIILYHPRLQLRPDGSAVPQTNEDYLSIFAESCRLNNVKFIDMTDPFLDAYYESYVLPHGFSNTKIGTGHLNANGHRIIAETLANYIITEGEITE